MNNLRTFPLSSCKNLPPLFFMVHLLHRLYGVDAAEPANCVTCIGTLSFPTAPPTLRKLPKSQSRWMRCRQTLHESGFFLRKNHNCTKFLPFPSLFPPSSLPPPPHPFIYKSLSPSLCLPLSPFTPFSSPFSLAIRGGSRK